MAPNLQIVRRVDRSGPNQAPVFTLTCSLDVTPQDRQRITEHHAGWIFEFEKSTQPPPVFSDVLSLLDDPAPIHTFHSVRAALVMQEAIISACRDLIAYLNQVADFEYTNQETLPLEPDGIS